MADLKSSASALVEVWGYWCSWGFARDGSQDGFRVPLMARRWKAVAGDSGGGEIGNEKHD